MSTVLSTALSMHNFPNTFSTFYLSAIVLYGYYKLISYTKLFLTKQGL